MLCCVSKKSVPTVQEQKSNSASDLQEGVIRPSGEKRISECSFVDSYRGHNSREEDVPPVLLPCAICSRTFKPQSLEKHIKICEKSAAKKRKPFDSAKQRIQGTDLAEFLPKQGKRRPVFHEDKSIKPKTSWKQTHDEFLRAIRAARGEVDDVPTTRHVASVAPTAAPTRANEKGTCPSCNRQFGIKAYDRHVAWCKERAHRLPVSPATNIAKERLEARINYRAPGLKNRRITNREKYSPGSAVNISTASKMSPPGPKPKESASVPSCTRGNDSPAKPKSTVVRRSGHTRETSNIPGPMKSRVADRSNRPVEEYEPGPPSTQTSSSNPRRSSVLSNASLKSMKTNVRNTSPPSKSTSKCEGKFSPSSQQCQTLEPNFSEPVRLKTNLLSVRGYNNPKLNDITVNEDVIGMSVQPCNIHREHNMTSWKQISEDKIDVQLVERIDSPVVQVESQDTLQKTVKTNITNSKDDEFEKAFERHRRRTLMSPKDEELVKISETTKTSWASNIKKLDKTYLISDSQDCEPSDLQIPKFPSRKWKPVKNSPRVEFCTKDSTETTVPKLVQNFLESPGNLDCFESPINFGVHVKFASTPVPDGLCGNDNSSMTMEVPKSGVEQDICVSQDLEYSTESGAGWSGGMRLQEPLTLELGFLESIDDDSAAKSAHQKNVTITTPTEMMSNTLLVDVVDIKQISSAGMKSSPIICKEAKNTIVKVTSGTQLLDQDDLGIEAQLNNRDLEIGRPISPHGSINSPTSGCDQKNESSSRNGSSVNGSQPQRAQKAQIMDSCHDWKNTNSLVNSPLDSSSSPFHSPKDRCVYSAATSPRRGCRRKKRALKSLKNPEDSKVSVQDIRTDAKAKGKGDQEKSTKVSKSEHHMFGLTGRKTRKSGTICKRSSRMNLSDNESRTFESSIRHAEDPPTKRRQIYEENSLGTRNPQSAADNSDKPLRDSLRPDFSDRRRCGTYVIEKKSVPNISTSCNPVSAESLEDKPSVKKRRITESTRRDSMKRNDSTINDYDPRSGGSPSASLNASRIFMETTAEDDITVNDEISEIYDKYVNNNFDYDSENTVAESYTNDLELSNEKIVRDNKADDLIDPKSCSPCFDKIAKVTSDSVIIHAEKLHPPETGVSRSSCQSASDIQKRIRRSMNILRDSTDSLVSIVDTESRGIQLMNSSGCYEREICTIQPIVSGAATVSKMEKSMKFLPEISRTEFVSDSKITERKSKPSESTYWQKVAKVSQSRLINLDPPNESFRLVKRNPKTQFLPPMAPGNPCSIERSSGLDEDYDPFLAAERQMNELFADTSDQFLTEEQQLNNDHSPSIDSKVNQFPLSHSSAFVKYPSSPQANKRASVIAPPSEFDDFTSDFSSDSTETNSNPQDFFINNLNAQTRDLKEFEKLTEDCNRRVIIDKSKHTSGDDVNANSGRGKTFVSSVERSRKILEKVTPKVVRPAVNRSHSVRTVRATSAPRAPERKSSLKKSNSPKSDYSGISNASNNNSYAALSGSNLSLSSMLSSEADIKRSNSMFDELLSSFEDDGTSFPSLKSFLKSDSVSTSMSSQVPDSRIRNGMISDEELSSPDSYKRQNHSKLSADSAYSSLNRKCSNHGRSTTDMGARIEQEPSPKRRDAELGGSGKLKMSRFCHECGSRFPELAKFCCECGVKRLVL